MKVGDLVRINGCVQPVAAVTESGLIKAGGRLFYQNGVEMKHEPGPRLRFEKVLESEVDRLDSDL